MTKEAAGIRFVFIRNHFEVDPRPRVIEWNRKHRERREEELAPVSERYQNRIEFENFDLAWMGNVPEIQTTKGTISFIGDLKFFEQDIEDLMLDQQGTIEYEARRLNFRYHCRVRFNVSDVKNENGRKTIYLFFREPVMNTIS